MIVALKLTDMKPGQMAEVLGLDPELGLATISRLEDLGFAKGTALRFERRVAFNGPVVVRIGGGSLAVETAASDLIYVNMKADHAATR